MKAALLLALFLLAAPAAAQAPDPIGFDQDSLERHRIAGEQAARFDMPTLRARLDRAGVR